MSAIFSNLSNFFGWTITLIYLGMRPLASSRNGILCDFVPPIVTINISAPNEPPIPANINNIPKFIIILKFRKKKESCHDCVIIHEMNEMINTNFESL